MARASYQRGRQGLPLPACAAEAVLAAPSAAFAVCLRTIVEPQRFDVAKARG